MLIYGPLFDAQSQINRRYEILERILKEGALKTKKRKKEMKKKEKVEKTKILISTIWMSSRTLITVF